MKFSIRKPAMLLFMVFIMIPVLQAGYEIDARVDKTEVGFGESLILQVTITQELGRGAYSTRMTPQIERFPGFDIASTKSGHSTSFVNNYGISKSHMVYELVPQKAGEHQIPAISFKDPDGKTHSTEPIDIKVLPPQKNEASASVTGDEKSDSVESSNFRLFLIAGIIFALLIGTPFVLSAIGRFSSNKSEQDGFKDHTIEDAQILGEVKQPDSEKSQDYKQNSEATKIVQIDFIKQAEELKKQYANVDAEFYHRYFGLFKKAVVSRPNSFSDDLTFDELLNKISESVAATEAKTCSQRVAKDIELVMYANSKPERGFGQIEEDIKLLLSQLD